jgi:hypothetical protein
MDPKHEAALRAACSQMGLNADLIVSVTNDYLPKRAPIPVAVLKPAGELVSENEQVGEVVTAEPEPEPELITADGPKRRSRGAQL